MSRLFAASSLFLLCLHAHAEIGQPSGIKHQAEAAPTATPSPRAFPGKTVMHICYPITPLVARGCRRLRQALKEKSCAGGYDVIEVNHPTKSALRKMLRERKLPAHLLVIIDGAGTGEEISPFFSRMPASPLREETSKRALDDVSKALAETIDHPSIWRAACPSRDSCLPTESCTGASCSSNGTSELKTLLCGNAAFRKADRNNDGVVDISELGAHYCETASNGSIVALDYRLAPAASETKLPKLVPNRIIKEGSGLSEEISRLRKVDPSRSYVQSYVGQIYRLEYTDGQGSRQKIFLSDAFESPKEANKVLKQRDDRYPKDCSRVAGVSARRCSVVPAAKLYTLASRAPQVPCLRAIETDPDFRLYSPHQTSSARAVATRPKKAKLR